MTTKGGNMIVTLERPMAAVSSHSLAVRRLMLAPVVLCLSLSLVVMSGQYDRASALHVAKPVTLGTVIKAAPTKVMTVGKLVPGPIGLAINGIGFAAIAYAERDSWLPILKDLINSPVNEPEVSSPVTAEAMQVGNLKIGASEVTFAWTCTMNNCGDGGGQFNFKGLRCVSAQGVKHTVPDAWAQAGVSFKVFGSGQYPNNMGTVFSNTTGTGTATPCGLTSKVLGGTFRLNNTPTGQYLYTNAINADEGWSDSEHSQSATVTCRQPDGTMSTFSETIDGFPDRVSIPSCADRVPGSIPWSGSIKAGPKGGVQKELQSFTTDEALFGQYAGCFGPSGLQCVIRVWVDGAPCVIGADVCQTWRKLHLDEPARVECKFGPHVIDMGDCTQLQRAYRTDSDIRTLDTTDPAGNPASSLDPEVTTAPAPATTQSPSTTTTTAPAPSASAQPTTGTNPTAPSTSPNASTDPNSTGCYGAVWSWNPVDWVVVPVKCSLKWAFVPSTGYLDGKVNGLKTSMEGTTVHNYWNVFKSMSPAGSSGCEGPAFDVGSPFGSDSAVSYPMSACGGAAASLAATSRLILTIAISLGAGFACLRILGRSIGWDPGIGGGSASV
jgi:hypothetical protein